MRARRSERSRRRTAAVENCCGVFLSMADSIEGADRCKCRCASANGYHSGTRRRTGIDGSSGRLVIPPCVLSIFQSLKLAVTAIFDRRISSSAPSGTPEISSTHVRHRNRLQSHAEFWMIAAHVTASSRSSHRSAGEDSREKWSRASRIENCARAVARYSCSRFHPALRKRTRRPDAVESATDEMRTRETKQIYSPRFANALALARNVRISPAPGRKPYSASEIRTPI